MTGWKLLFLSLETDVSPYDFSMPAIWETPIVEDDVHGKNRCVLRSKEVELTTPLHQPTTTKIELHAGVIK